MFYVVPVSKPLGALIATNACSNLSCAVKPLSFSVDTPGWFRWFHHEAIVVCSAESIITG